MKPKDQEALVAEVVEALAAKYLRGCAEVGRGTANKFTGASGFGHQIDVSVMLDGCLALYECKYWRQNVGTSAILTFAARVIDIRDANPGLRVDPYIVVNRNLTSGAKKLAGYFQIEQLVARSPSELGVSLLTHHDARVRDGIGFSDG